MSKQTTPLRKGYSQLEVRITLRHRSQVNDTMIVTFESEPTEEALKRYREWMAKVTNSIPTEIALRAVQAFIDSQVGNTQPTPPLCPPV